MLYLYLSSKDIEINKERADIEKYKRSLQIQLQDLQFDLEKQRNELKTEFDEVIRKREHEWRILDDELNTQIIAKDLQLKLLNNENDKLKETNEQLRKSVDEAESCKRTAERLLKEKEWELKDFCTLKDAKINDLEKKLLKNDEEFKEKHEEYLKKYFIF
jgi:serine phosphatase RsbU (regulator of sigma subunit)